MRCEGFEIRTELGAERTKSALAHELIRSTEAGGKSNAAVAIKAKEQTHTMPRLQLSADCVKIGVRKPLAAVPGL